MERPEGELYGVAVGMCLLDIGWSTRELARRLGTTPVIIKRIIEGQGRLANQRLTVAESKTLLEIAAFMREHKMPRRKTPSRK